MNTGTVRVINIGCKTNYHDACCIESRFMERGVRVLSSLTPLNGESADMYVVNSCTVTKKADRDSLRMIRRIKRLHPESKIVVTGCMAQVAWERLEGMDDIDFIVGNTQKFRIPEIVLEKTRARVDEGWEKRPSMSHISSLSGRTRAFLRIQDGCNGNCSFCIIRKARGPERSLTISEVIEQLHEMVRLGFREVNLTGIRLGHFGSGSGETLLELLKEIEEDSGLSLRVRVGSLYPDEIGEDFIAFLEHSRKLCKHVHISQQSLSNEILSKMNRPGSAARFVAIVEGLRARVPRCFVGCDLIVGFPSESEEQFLETYNTLSKVSVSDVHVFSFSPRDGTDAALMGPGVSDAIKKERVRRLRNLAATKRLNFLKDMVGSTLELLPLRNSKREGNLMKGITDNYLPVLIPYNRCLVNRLIKVFITDTDDCFLAGEVVHGRGEKTDEERQQGSW